MSTAPLHGTDVSRWQGKIDWKQVATLPLHIVLAQIGWKSEGRPYGILDVDPEYFANIAGMKANGGGWAVGHYLVPIGTAPLSTQADKAIALMRASVGWPLPQRHCLMLDMEYNDLSGYSQSELVNWAIKISQSLGRPLLWYGTLALGIGHPAIASWPKVCADYSYGNDAATYEDALAQMYKRYAGVQNIAVHQWGVGAPIPGISTRTDMLAMVNHLPLTAALGLGGYVANDPTKSEGK